MLERLYCFKHHLSIFKECLIIPVSLSDHSLVQCTVTLSSIKPKRAYWHINITLTHDTLFKDIFKSFWEDFFKLQIFF